jgi:hypothetical protein
MATFCSLSLSAQATVTRSIYLRRALAVSVTELSFKGNSKLHYSSTNASSFQQIKVVLKVPVHTGFRSVNRIKRQGFLISQIVLFGSVAFLYPRGALSS